LILVVGMPEGATNAMLPKMLPSTDWDCR